MKKATYSENVPLNYKTTVELDEMLGKIMESPHPEEQSETVLQILRILEDREKGMVFQMTPRIKAAYRNFLRNIGVPEEEI